MAYVKTTWATGDVITAAKLNNMEGGIEDAHVLYGPYLAQTNPGSTIAASQFKNITLANITSLDGQHFYDPGYDPLNTFVHSVKFSSTASAKTNLYLRNFSGLYIDAEMSRTEASVSIFNGTSEAIDTSNFSLVFYADRPLEEYQPD